MRNTITEIILLPNSPGRTFELSATCTLVTGFSGKGKTLLFKMIIFALGDDSNIDIEEAKNHYGELDRISIKFSNGMTFTRCFTTEFKAEIETLEGDTLTFDDKTRYREEVGKLFNHKNVKLITNETKSTQKSFTVPEYISTLFFSESRVAEEKTLIETEGHANELKLSNYYKYFVTGDFINEELASQDKKRKKDDSEVESVIKFLSKKSKTTTTKAKNQLKELKKNQERLLLKIETNEQTIDGKKAEIKQLSVDRSRLVALSSLYENQVSELTCVHVLDDHMSNAFFRCDNCNEIVRWNTEDVNEQIGMLQSRIKQIKETSRQIDYEIGKARDDIKRLKATNEEIIAESDTILSNIKDLESELSAQLAYDRAKNALLALRQKSEEKPVVTLDAEKMRINTLFSVQIDDLCKKIGSRLGTWGVFSKKEVTFDHEKFDFRFSGTLRPLLAKGYKTFCTVAMIVELMLHMKKVGVPCFDFILIDTVWKVADFEVEDLDSVCLNFMNDMATCGIQVIVFENQPPKEFSDSYKNIRLN